MEQKVITPLDGSPHQKYFVGDIEVPGGSTIAKYGGDPGGMVHRAWQLGAEGRNYREEWDDASVIGDIAHAFIQENLANARVDLRHAESYPMCVAVARSCAAKALWFVQENEFEIIAVEEQLSRPYTLPDGTPYGYGGTIDLVVRATKQTKNYETGDVIGVDWKSSSGLYPIPNYCQIIGYEHLWNHCRPDLPWKRRVIVRIGKGDGNDYQERWIKKQTTLDKYWAIFQTQLQLWHKIKVIK